MTRICVPICARSIDELRDAIEPAAAVADLIELRLDCLDDLETASRLLGQDPAIGRPLILTLRAAEQGGHSSVDYDSRRRFWSSLKPPITECFFDLEYDLVQDLSVDWSASVSVANDCKRGRLRSSHDSGATSAWLDADWQQIICSHHDFNGVPKDLERIYEEMAGTPAGIIKIAVQANDATDCLPIFKLLERARGEDRELIAIAMGPAGIVTRVLGPSRGSFLTYGSLEDERATAPGQLTAKQLRDVYRIDRINSETEVFGVLGRPVAQSWSPYMHNAAFAAVGLNAVYLPFETQDVSGFIRRLVHPATREIDWKLHGLSVTIPHKTTVMPLLDAVDPVAQEIGAVNTIVVARDRRLFGFNTDAAGFMAPLHARFGSVRDARCAVIGAGGGARSALWALIKEGASVALFARNLEASAATAGDFGVSCQQLSQANFAEFDIVVNATSMGMSGAQQDMTPALADQFNGVRLAYDLVYNPLETLFLREARAAGCEVLGGLEMLIAQASAQFKLWTGKEPDTEVMRAGALSQLAN